MILRPSGQKLTVKGFVASGVPPAEGTPGRGQPEQGGGIIIIYICVYLDI